MRPRQTEPTLTVLSGDKPAGRPLPCDPDALLFTSEAAYLTGLSVRTLEALRLRGGGPPFVAFGRRAVRYHRRDLMAFIESHRRRSTSDPGSSSSTPTSETK